MVHPPATAGSLEHQIHQWWWAQLQEMDCGGVHSASDPVVCGTTDSEYHTLQSALPVLSVSF